MYKRFFTICLIFILIILSFGCDKTESTVELPVLDEETRISIENVWSEYPEPQQWYSEVCRSGLEGARYYGRYGYVDVWFYVQEPGTAAEIEIGGIRFASECRFLLRAFNGVHDWPLEFAYENRQVLSREDLEVIAAVHQAYEQRIADKRAELDGDTMLEPSGELVLPTVSEEIRQELEQAHQGAFGYIPPWVSERNGGYYGTYNGCSVFFLHGQLTSADSKVIAGETFWHSESFLLYAYRDGYWKMLEDAYDYGWLTKADIAHIARIHAEYERLEHLD